MTFEEWWLKEELTVLQQLHDDLPQLGGLIASLRHFMEIAWLEGYAQGQMDSTPYQVP